MTRAPLLSAGLAVGTSPRRRPSRWLILRRRRATGAPITISWDPASLNPLWTYTLVDELSDPDVEVDLAGVSTLDTGDYDEADDPDCAAFPLGTPSACIRNAAFLLVDVQVIIVPSITPINAPVVIPAAGGSVSYSVAIANTTDQPQTFQAWVTATLPNGALFGTVEGPRTVRLQANQVVGVALIRGQVPRGAPAGIYTLTLNVGTHPNAVTASDTFTFEKTAARGGAPPAVAAGAGATATGVEVFPNPVASRATVRFEMEKAGEICLAVYDVLGREVVVLAEGAVAAGRHDVAFDRGSLAGGTYVWRLVRGGGADRSAETGRLTLLD